MEKAKIRSKILWGLLFVVVIFFCISLVITGIRARLEMKRENLYIKECARLDSLSVLCSIEKAYENIKRGNLIAYYNGVPHFEEISYGKYGVYNQPIVDMEIRTKSIQLMDSVIFARFGRDFFQKVDSEALILSNKLPGYIDNYGFYTSASKEPGYICEDIHEHILDDLFKIGLLPLLQDTCFPNKLVIDAIITKQGKLINPQILLKVDPILDSIVVDRLLHLPCDWIPAYFGERTVEYRKRFYFILPLLPRDQCH